VWNERYAGREVLDFGVTWHPDVKHSAREQAEHYLILKTGTFSLIPTVKVVLFLCSGDNRHTICGMKCSVPHLEVFILEEKLRALNTLVRYESNPESLKQYHAQLALVACELNDRRRTIKRSQQAFAAAA
jgi:hypothetical protein